MVSYVFQTFVVALLCWTGSDFYAHPNSDVDCSTHIPRRQNLFLSIANSECES
jgi:hypothetical protein